VLATGRQKLERMRDGRAVYTGAERVDDVTIHPAFRAGAQTIAALYDLKADPATHDLFSYEETSGRGGSQRAQSVRTSESVSPLAWESKIGMLWNSRQRGRALWHATRALFEPLCF
jgi:aromatic ring hydroxylase